MPYPIPDNLDDIEGWRWYLVPLPDSDPMIRIAWGMWSELTNYWMWGEEGTVPQDSDKAAQLWSEALYEAWRVRDMGFPDAILGYIDEVETLLRALQNLQGAGAACCDNLSATGETVDTDLDSGGPPPSTWGDGETVADLSDWEQLVCGAAHAYVDHLKDMADQLNTIVGASAIAVGAIASILGLLSGAGIILAISYGSAAAVVAALISGATSATFGDTADDIEAARQQIVCQVFNGNAASLASAVEDAIGTTAWNLFFSFVDYESARNVMLEGTHGSEYLGVNRRSDCDCTQDLGLWDVQTGAYIVPIGSLNLGTWYQVPSAVLSFGGGDWGRARFQIRDNGGNPIDVNAEVRAVSYCNSGVAESTPYANTAAAISSTQTEYVEHPGLASFSYTGLFREALATSSTYQSCSGFVLEVRVTSIP